MEHAEGEQKSILMFAMFSIQTIFGLNTKNDTYRN